MRTKHNPVERMQEEVEIGMHFAIRFCCKILITVTIQTEYKF